MITNICECGSEIKTYPSRMAEGRGKYCSRKCSDKHTLLKRGERRSPNTEFKRGQMPYNFKGFRYTKPRKNSSRYIMTYIPNHPYATRSGHVREHRLVMERKIGRYLHPDEIVHHIDGNTLNNSPGNLRVMKKVEHDRMNTHLNIHRRWQKGV